MDECVALRCSVRERGGLAGSVKDEWVVLQTVGCACYHKITESMLNEKSNCLSGLGLGKTRKRRE